MRVIGGRYEIQAQIASGGMASVHLARQVGAAGYSRIVAVKRLHERFAHDPAFVAMFLDEARLVARIRHPNVVQTVDVVTENGDDGGELFIVMEYIHGESLLRLLSNEAQRGGAIPAAITSAIIVGALHGLHDAHEARDELGAPLGIVHRDISPHNILVGADGIARVLDFGIAKASSRITTTSEGQLKGKLTYMAPEQVSGAQMDRRTDVYAAAVVMWEMLTGKKLRDGDNEAMIFNQILAVTPPPPSRVRSGIPAALDAVVLRGLASEPTERFATALELASAISGAVTPASVAELSAWVRATCGAELGAKSRIIAAIESRSSSQNLRDAVESLRAMTGRPSLQPPFVVGAGPAPAPTPRGSIPMPPTPSGSLYPGTAAPLSLSPGTGTGSTLVGSRGTLGLVLGGGALLASLVGGGLILRARQNNASLADVAAKTSLSASASAVRSAAPATSAPVAAACPAEMVAVPGGRFFMGSDDDLPNEKPAHNVTISAFCIDRHEVTTDEYRACSDRGECKRAGTTNRWEGITAKQQATYDPLCNIGAKDRGNHPINCVDWASADRFCRAAGKRLPTEAEWEFAARGSDGRKYPWGDAPPTAKHLNACGKECVRWLDKRREKNDGFLYAEDDGWPTTAPVGSFPLGMSRWGAEDMVGNVWEWVADWSGPYSANDQTNPTGPAAGAKRVIRGGAWNGAYPDWVRPTFRYESEPESRTHGIGFRCAKAP